MTLYSWITLSILYTNLVGTNKKVVPNVFLLTHSPKDSSKESHKDAASTWWYHPHITGYSVTYTLSQFQHFCLNRFLNIITSLLYNLLLLSSCSTHFHVMSSQHNIHFTSMPQFIESEKERSFLWHTETAEVQCNCKRIPKAETFEAVFMSK